MLDIGGWMGYIGSFGGIIGKFGSTGSIVVIPEYDLPSSPSLLAYNKTFSVDTNPLNIMVVPSLIGILPLRYNNLNYGRRRMITLFGNTSRCNLSQPSNASIYNVFTFFIP